jgi:hypothetical protein
MSLSLLALACLLLSSLFQLNATPAPDPNSAERNLIQFGNMIAKTLGTSALSYNGYGCW